MKLFMKFILTFSFIVLLLNTGGTASAKSNITIDGGVLYEQRVLVPMRAIFENFGATVHWDQASRKVTATKGETTIVLGINEQWATVNGEHINLDVHSQINDNITVVPLRFVGETFGAKVGWDGKNHIATVETAEKLIKVEVNTFIKVISETTQPSKTDSSKSTKSSTFETTDESYNSMDFLGKLDYLLFTTGELKIGVKDNYIYQTFGKPNQIGKIPDPYDPYNEKKWIVAWNYNLYNDSYYGFNFESNQQFFFNQSGVLIKVGGSSGMKGEYW